MYLFYLIITLIMIGADFFTKILAVNSLKNGASIPVIKDVFHFTYCENTGGAFSLFEGNPYLLAGISLALIGGAVYYVLAKKPKSHILLLSLSMIVAGGMGNIIDRITKGYVVDFLHFCLIDFPVFNVADIFVCIGMGLFAYYILFIHDKVVKEK